MVSIRGAREGDLERLIEVHGASYPDERSSAVRRANFTNNAFGKLGDLRVAVDSKKRIVGHGFGFSMRAFFGGVAVPAVGIASVAVAPEARGLGVGKAIVSAIEKEARKRGASICILHAFRHGFYARLGYANVACNQRLVCDPRAIPKKWIERAHAIDLRAATVKDVATLADIHEHVAKTQTGWLARATSLWTRMLQDERSYFVLAGASGFVAFEMIQSEAHDETRLLVSELVAKDDDTRRALFGFLATQAGQSSAIEFETRIDDPIAFALTDADGNRFGNERVEHDLGGVIAGPMIRVLDVRAAIEARGFWADGEIDLKVDEKIFRIVIRDGRATLKKSKGATHTLAMDARTFASIAFGGLRASSAASLGLVRARASLVESADALLFIPPFFTLDRF
jgi:predicted acetyltransferase